MSIQDIITDAVSASSSNAGVRTTAAKLAEAWIDYGYGTADEPGRFRNLEIIGTEVPFWIRLSSTVYAAGYADTLFREPTTGGVFCQEIKTTKSDKWYGETDWLKEIRRSAQPAIEALATVAGRWGATGMTIGTGDGACVQVAALTKTSAPELWPRDPKDGVLVYTAADLAACRNMLLATAAAIFKLRRQEAPWQWTGRQCVVFEGGGKKRDCEFMEPYCGPRKTAMKAEAGDGDDTRSSDLRRLIERVEGLPAGQLDDPGYVVLSKSSIELLHGCWEKYRIGKELGHRGPSSTAMEIGSATHAAIGALHDAMVRKDVTV